MVSWGGLGGRSPPLRPPRKFREGGLGGRSPPRKPWGGLGGRSPPRNLRYPPSVCPSVRRPSVGFGSLTSEFFRRNFFVGIFSWEFFRRNFFRPSSVRRPSVVRPSSVRPSDGRRCSLTSAFVACDTPLATNRPQDLDAAMMRRVSLAIEFGTQSLGMGMSCCIVIR